MMRWGVDSENVLQRHLATRGRPRRWPRLQAQMAEDPLDHGRLENCRNDPKPAAAVQAMLKIEIKDPLEQARPSWPNEPVCAMGFTGLRLRCRGGLVWRFGHHLRAQL